MRWTYLIGIIVTSAAVATSATALEDRDNVLANSSFEEIYADTESAPMAWFPFSSKPTDSGVSDRAFKEGGRCFMLSSIEEPEQFQGIVQPIPVTAGKKYTFKGYIKNSPDNPLAGTAYLQMVIEWKDANDKEISRAATDWYDGSTSTKKWEELKFHRIKAPKGAVKAVVGFHLYEGEQGGTGALFLDAAYTKEY